MVSLTYLICFLNLFGFYSKNYIACSIDSEIKNKEFKKDVIFKLQFIKF